MTTGRPVFLAGIFAYVISWFLRVLPDPNGFDFEDDPVRGWSAFLSAIWWPFTPEPTAGCAEALSVLSALTNLLMVGAVFVLLRRRGPAPRAVTISLALAAILNTYWFFLSGPAWAVGMNPDMVRLAGPPKCSALIGVGGPLLAGYYVWLLSFVLVAIASHLHRGGSAGPLR